MPFASFFPSSASQQIWRDHMKQTYIKNHRFGPCVFQVPDNVRDTNPEAYIPQIVGLGPYHHFRPEVQLMSSKKRDAVKDYLGIVDFSNFVDLLNKSPEEFELITRSCYDQYLDLEKETLSWIVILDAIVFLHFINTYLGRKEERHKIYPDVKKLVPDFFKLENQIPIILALEVRKHFGLTVNVNTDIELFDKLHRFCKKKSPLQLTTVPELRQEAFDKNNHMLHFMYQMIINNKGPEDRQGREPERSDRESQGANQETLKNIGVIARVAADHVGELFHHVAEEFNSALAKAENAGLNVPGNIQKVSQLLQKFESTFRLQQSNQVFPDDKIEIPSVSRLTAILNIKFKRLPDDRGIGDIDLKDAGGRKYIFYLPVIHMRSSSDVILRNLVAYEATLSTQPQQGSTRLRDYVDLMCGLIKSDKDVQLLKDAQIIDTELPNQEITNMCQRIKKSDEMPDDQSAVHKTVQGANNQFNNSRFVKSWRGFMKFFAFIVKIFWAIFPLLIFIFLALQSACEIIDCRVRPNGGGAAAMRNLNFGDSFELDPQAKLMLPRKLLQY